jgi:hypothetical protein
VSPTNYARGYAIENKLVNLYRDNGWVATRTAGSHGAFDVAAFGPNGEIHLAQLKSQNGIGVGYFRDITRLSELNVNQGIQKIFLVWRNGWGWIRVQELHGSLRFGLPTWYPQPRSVSAKPATSI